VRRSVEDASSGVNRPTSSASPIDRANAQAVLAFSPLYRSHVRYGA